MDLTFCAQSQRHNRFVLTWTALKMKSVFLGEFVISCEIPSALHFLKPLSFFFLVVALPAAAAASGKHLYLRLDLS